MSCSGIKWTYARKFKSWFGWVFITNITKDFNSKHLLKSTLGEISRCSNDGDESANGGTMEESEVTGRWCRVEMMALHRLSVLYIQALQHWSVRSVLFFSPAPSPIPHFSAVFDPVSRVSQMEMFPFKSSIKHLHFWTFAFFEQLDHASL